MHWGQNFNQASVQEVTDCPARSHHLTTSWSSSKLKNKPSDCEPVTADCEHTDVCGPSLSHWLCLSERRPYYRTYPAALPPPPYQEAGTRFWPHGATLENKLWGARTATDLTIYLKNKYRHLRLEPELICLSLWRISVLNHTVGDGMSDYLAVFY